MLNFYFQAAAGAAVLLVWLILLSVARKKATFGRIAATVMTVAVLGTAVYGGIVTANAASKANVLPTGNVRALNAELVYTYAQNGRPDAAQELLKKQMKNGGTPEELLLMARLTALNGRYDEAALLYDKYLALVGRGFNAGADEESDRVKMLTGGSGWFTGNAVFDGQIRLLRDRKEAGELDPASEAQLAAYLSTVPADVKTLSAAERDQLKTVLETQIRDNVGKAWEENTDALSGEDRRAVTKMAEAVLEVEKQCDAAEGIGDTPYSEEKLREAVKELKKLMKRDPAFLADPYLRNVLLRGNVLLGDSGAIAEMIDENATPEELSVAIDLYVRGLVTADDFTQVSSLTTSEARALSERVEQIRSDRSGDMTSVEKQQAREVKDYLSSDDHMIVGKIASDLAYGENTAEDSEKSKYYIDSAIGWNAIGNDKKAEDCIDQALENRSESKDVQFVEAMEELVRTLNGGEDTSVVDFPNNVKIVVDHLTRYDLDNMEPTPRAVRQAEKEAGENPENPPAYEEQFPTFFTDTLSRKRAAISIGQIDKDAFPKIGARIALSDSLKVSESDFKKNFTVSDCSHEIGNYTVTKMERVSGNIVLCCDMSGSMSGSDDDLRTAVHAFIDSMTGSEKVSIVGFTSSVEFDSGLMTDKDQLRTYADRIYASGGTAVYPTLTYVLGQMTVESNTQNIVIMMTDGQDGSAASENTLNTSFAALAAEKGCTVYTVGLGSSIDQYYLEKIAAVGNGEFLYVDSADSLSGFYDFIHAQLSNQYYIEFEAPDRLMNVRELAIYQNGTVNSAHKQYRLSDEGEDPEVDNGAIRAEQLGDFRLFGLSSSYIYRSKQDIRLKVNGSGFENQTGYTVKLSGELRATKVSSKVIDSETLEIVVPSTIAVGKYDLVVSAEGEKDKVLPGALTVALPCTLTHITFGSYDFTAEQIVEEGSQSYRLTGNVAMNGWLHFKGDVMLRGDLKDNRDTAYLIVTDESGAYVSYSPNGTTGLTKKLFADKGRNLIIPAMQSFRIYGAPYDQKAYGDFMVDTIRLQFPINIQTFASVGGQVALYPDMICSDAFYVTPDFTYLDDLIPNFRDTVYDVRATGTLAITNSDVCVAASVSLNYDSGADAGRKFQFLSTGLNLKEAGVELNTITQSYKIAAGIGFNDFRLSNKRDTAANGLGLTIGWSDGKLDSVSFSADTKVKVSDTPVPIYLSDVSFGFSGAAKADYTDWYTYLTRTTIEGGFGLETVGLSDVASDKIIEFFGIEDVKIAELDEGQISMTLKDFCLSFGAKLKFLGREVASCSVDVGKFNYRNTLLGIEETEYGAGASVKLDLFIYDFDHLKVDFSGSSEITVGYPYTGMKLSGTADYSVSWFIFEFGKEKEGEIGIGFYKNSRDKLQFTFAYRGTDDNGELKGFRLDVSDNGAQKTRY